MTHATGLDFVALYPSVFSSVVNRNIPYTDHKMYMPGRLIKEFMVETKEQFNEAMRIINEKKTLFIVALKGHIDEKYINKCINMPPIIRNIEIITNEQTIGPYMYKYMKDNGMKVDRKERKLTQTLKTFGTIILNNYYLWGLIDMCGFIIDEIEWISTWSKHDGFNEFVTSFMDKRIRAKVDGNDGLEMFCKTNLNGSYGFDAKNTEKYTKTQIKNRSDTIIAQIFPEFVDSRKINNNQYIVSRKPKYYKCDTPIQEALFTLDNAKYWYLNFYYNFMCKAFDMDRIHFIEGDTDSMYFAIAGDPNEDYTQGFKHVIKDQEFYDKHVYEWFPKPNNDRYLAMKDEKKLLGLCIENQGENMIALSPKCYTIDKPGQPTIKVKGINKKQNKIECDDYMKAITTKIDGKNISLQMNRSEEEYQMSMKMIEKTALTGANTKMYVMENQSCAPFGFDKYVIEN